MGVNPSPQFINSLNAALSFWKRQQKTAAISEMDRERQNLNRIIEMGLTLPETRVAAIEAILGAFDLVYNMGYWREWLPVLESAVAACPEEEQPLRIDLQLLYGEFLRFNGYSKAAISAHESALRLVGQIDDPLRSGKAYARLGDAFREEGEFEIAKKHCQSALTILEKTGEAGRPFIANTLSALGDIAWRMGDFVNAKDYFEKAAVIRRENSDSLRLAQTLNDLASVCRSDNDLIQSLKYYYEAEQLLAGIENKLDLLLIQYSRGILLFGQNLWAQAEEVFRGIDLDYLQQTRNLLYQAKVITALGNTILYQERPDEAATLLQRAVIYWTELDDKLELANAIGSLGEALAARGEKDAAENRLKEASSLLDQLPNHPRVVKLKQLFSAELQKLS